MIAFLIMYLIGIIVIVVAAISFKTNVEYRGNIGEKITTEHLNTLKGNKRIINNIMINDNGKTRQIDHIAITEHGIFVIETKNFAGKIYGRSTSSEWKQYLGGKAYPFFNPIHQNFGHTKIVKELLKEETTDIFPIVAFSRRCELKVEADPNEVMYMDKVVPFIENKPKVLNINQIEKIYDKIMNNRVTNEEYIRNHNYNVKRYVESKNIKKGNGICPRCNGKLIEKNGKYGKFYSCTNYPKCKYTSSISK